MRQCSRCSGLVPEGSSVCPNCDVSPRASKAKLALMVSALAVANGCSCQPVYGLSVTCDENPAACCDELLPDGGDPKKDSENVCFVDGGTP